MSLLFSRRCAASLLFLAMLSTRSALAGDEQLPPETLKKVKQATVALHVTLADGRVVEGSGFMAGTNFGSTRQTQEVIADVTFTLHGMRERMGRTEAVIFLSGQVRGEKGAGLGASGRMHGQAVVNLTTNQVTYADTNLNLDLDLSDGRDTMQANGSLRIVMQRKELPDEK